jgi:hypothetical protein
MTGKTGHSAGARYFYLSYVPAPARDERLLGDPWVRRFFDDLNMAIDDQPGDRLRLHGFADFIVRRSEDRPRLRKIALAEAEVFVPLYSPDYLNREDLRKERESFRRKLINAGRSVDGDNMLPVLWTPLPSPAHVSEQARALTVAADLEAYAANGMSALCRMRTFHSEYQAVLSRLARHIVVTAERSPLSPAQPANEPVDVPASKPSEVPFLAVVIAPDRDEPPSDRTKLNGYFGTRVAHWRPFSNRSPIVDDVTAAVQRLRMPIEVGEFVPGEGQFADCPGVLMIDPYVVVTKNGPETLRAAVGCIRNWVGVAVIVDEGAAGQGAQPTDLAERVIKMFPDAANVSTFTSHDDWRVGIHNLVDRMRRRYLDERPAYPPKGPPPPRPRLFEGRPPDERPGDQSGPGRTE